MHLNSNCRESNVALLVSGHCSAAAQITSPHTYGLTRSHFLGAGLFGVAGGERRIVSICVVAGRRWASFTGMNCPFPESRPIFVFLVAILDPFPANCRYFAPTTDRF